MEDAHKQRSSDLMHVWLDRLSEVRTNLHANGLALQDARDEYEWATRRCGYEIGNAEDTEISLAGSEKDYATNDRARTRLLKLALEDSTKYPEVEKARRRVQETRRKMENCERVDELLRHESKSLWAALHALAGH